MEKKKKVLVVDDDRAVRTMLRNALEANGFAVHCCGNGTTALKMTEDTHYDAVITEQYLPGMNGAAMARQLRAQLPHATIIGMSNVHCAGEMQNICNAVLNKPLVLPELISLLRGHQKEH